MSTQFFFFFCLHRVKCQNSSISNSSIWPIDWVLSGATTVVLSELGSNGHKGVIRIPQNTSNTWASLSDYLVSYPGHKIEDFFPFAEMQSVYPTSQADWAILKRKYLVREDSRV